jgi:hypothetical protein
VRRALTNAQKYSSCSHMAKYTAFETFVLDPALVWY